MHSYRSLVSERRTLFGRLIMMATSMCGHVWITLFILFVSLSSVLSKSKIVHLNEDNWNQMLEGEWMVEFFAPWCPACKALDSIWKDYAEWSEDLGIQIAQVDVTANPGLSGRFIVTALPTIYHVLDGKFRQYRGSRSKEDFISFIEDKKWESLEEVPGWKSPSSTQMSLVSYFFKLSMILRSIHTKLIEEFGLPYWGSYLLFALATILIGAILGLILVCIIDFVFPPKSPIMMLPKTDATSSTSKKDDDRIPKAEDDDVIEDDSNKLNENSTATTNDDLRKRKTARKEE